MIVTPKKEKASGQAGFLKNVDYRVNSVNRTRARNRNTNE